ncbi:MAG: hypothetical protein JNK05_18635 [Myxococcales bacterium]|nr:hypothetical protein [Myxococcales bacterium]
MTGHRKWIGFLTALLASSSAFAQAAGGEGEGGGGSANAAPAAGEWRTYRNERHVIARLQGGPAFRLYDPFSAGAIGPGWIHAQGGFLFLNVGKLRMGPSLGGQLGLDLGHSGLQGTIQPGWSLMFRPSPRWAILGRVDFSMAFVRTSVFANDLCVYNRPVNPIVPCAADNMMPARLAYGTTTAVAMGFEAGGTFAFFLTGGVALTAELNTGVYFGDSGTSAPLIGLGLGALFDYELLP